MTFAAPLFAWGAAAVAVATVALHLLAWRRPPESPLPTARFAPERPIRMVSRAVRPADLALLALRVVLVMAVGLALAGPSFDARREGLGRVIVMDRSASVGNEAEVASAARAAFRAGDAVVVFDSVAREVVAPVPDSLTASRSTRGRGLISAALVAAVRAAVRLERERDSVEIVVFSPVAGGQLDAATRAVRATWPGRLRVVRVGGVPDDTMSLRRVEVRAPDADPVAVALGLEAPVAGGALVRVVRDAPTGVDSAWAQGGRAIVVWPAATGPGWQRRPDIDTVFAVTALAAGDGDARAATVVAPFARTVVPPAGRAVARWTDGEPAVTETALGAGCVRSVAVAVPSVGDLPLTPAFRHFARRLAEPCHGQNRHTPVADSVVASVLPATLPAADRVNVATLGAGMPRSRATAWLLALALVLAAAEMWVRRGGSNATA